MEVQKIEAIKKINSLYILSNDQKEQYINMIQQAGIEEVVFLNKKLDIIISKMIKFTDKVFNKSSNSHDRQHVPKKSDHTQRQA